MDGQALTTKEIGLIEECLKAEILAVTKAQNFERATQDSELREFCRECVQSGQRHIDELLQLLN